MGTNRDFFKHMINEFIKSYGKFSLQTTIFIHYAKEKKLSFFLHILESVINF